MRSSSGTSSFLGESTACVSLDLRAFQLTISLPDVPQAEQNPVSSVELFASSLPRPDPLVRFLRPTCRRDEAVETYKSRYGRSPPKGFDAWWKFARLNDVLIVRSLFFFLRRVQASMLMSLPSSSFCRSTMLVACLHPLISAVPC